MIVRVRATLYGAPPLARDGTGSHVAIAARRAVEAILDDRDARKRLRSEAGIDVHLDLVEGS